LDTDYTDDSAEKKAFLTAKNAKGAKFFKVYLPIVYVLDEILQDSQPFP